MKALENIKNKAEVIITDLCNKEINRLKTNTEGIMEYLDANPDAYIKSTYGNTNWSKTVRRYNELPGNDCEILEFLMTRRLNWEVELTHDFMVSNMKKLNRALAKHITDDMTAKNIKVFIGGDGAEITANVDDKFFRTFGTLCGGYVQCLHYRYRSSLK